jgi:hypothetical protein
VIFVLRNSQTNVFAKDIAPGALEKPVCRIWLKIGILVDFEVLNKVQMDLKALAPLLDPLRVT